MKEEDKEQKMTGVRNRSIRGEETKGMERGAHKEVDVYRSHPRVML